MDKLTLAEEVVAESMPEVSAEDMERFRNLIHDASREYVKRQIRTVEYRNEKEKRRKKTKLQKASRRTNRK